MKSLEITSAITALANLISTSLTPGEATLVASLLVQLGDTLATIAANEALSIEQAEKEKDR